MRAGYSRLAAVFAITISLVLLWEFTGPKTRDPGWGEAATSLVITQAGYCLALLGLPHLQRQSRGRKLLTAVGLSLALAVVTLSIGLGVVFVIELFFLSGI
jgi:hypothetical protein